MQTIAAHKINQLCGTSPLANAGAIFYVLPFVLIIMSLFYYSRTSDSGPSE